MERPHRPTDQSAVRFPNTVSTSADLDGDGRREAALCDGQFGGPAHVVEAVSLETGEPILRTTIHASVPGQTPKDWPRYVDLNGDGRPSQRCRAGQANRYYLRVADIRTGSTLWERLLPIERIDSSDERCGVRMIDGPDINGDGWRELFLATVAMQTQRSPTSHQVFVDAISGRDGRLLWSWKRDFRGDEHSVSLGSLQWAWPGRDGWPTLAVPHRYAVPSAFPSETVLLEVGQGELSEILAGVREARSADVNGDGLTDLFWYAPLVQNNPTFGGELQCVRGGISAWRRLEQWQPAADFDGDGVADSINAGGGAPSALSAVSGRDGKSLWRSNFSGELFLCRPAPTGDLNGDGVADVLALRQANASSPCPLSAISGKDGSLLWNAEGPQADSDTFIRSGQFLQLEDLDGDGVGEVIAALISELSNRQRFELIVYAGRSGKVVWRREFENTRPWRQIWPAYLDLTGDGTKDLALPIDEADAVVVTIDGRNGKTLWRRRINNHHWDSATRGAQRPLAAAPGLTPDGRPGLIVNADRVIALDAQGQEVWAWKFQREPGQEAWLSWPRGRIKTAVVRRPAPRRCGVYVFYTVDVHRRSGSVESQTHVVECDEQGQIVQQAFFSPHASLVCYDIDGDGGDETLVLTDEELQVFAGRLDAKPAWTWRRPQGQGEIIAERPSPGDRAATVAVAIDHVVYGVAEGELRWRTTVAEPVSDRLRQRFALETPQLLASSGDQLPSFLAASWPGSLRSGQGVVCRKAVATAPDGKYLTPRAQTRPYDEIVRDPRQFRPLPWSRFGETLPWMSLAALAIASAANFLAFRWGRRPPLSGVMLTLMTLAALALAGLLSVGLLPAVIFLFLMIRYAVQRRLRACAVLTLAALNASAVIAAVALWVESQTMLPGQRFQWEGWYAPLYFGVYATGLMALPALGILRLARRGAEQRRARLGISQTGARSRRRTALAAGLSDGFAAPAVGM